MERIYLKPGDRIQLCEDESSVTSKEWEIVSFVGEGSFSVCYSAKCANKFGLLKEFYPLAENLLTRRKDNQLVAVNNQRSLVRFAKMCADYLSCFKILDKARLEKGVMLINNFVPVQRPLYGFAKDDKASVYIWSPDSKHGITFEEYIKSVRAAPHKMPQLALFNIMQAVTHLTECVKTLHEIGLVHLDLKPSNFLVTYTADKIINPKNISLFDLNSLCNLERIPPDFSIVGTDAFAAPELMDAKISNLCDVYSIGAILFYSTVVDKDIPDGLYRAKYFQGINQFVSRSKLLACVDTDNIALKALLSKILKGCLAIRSRNRYRNCEALLEDLNKVLALLMPAVAADTLKDLNKKVILSDADEEIQNPMIILQDLLYKVPLITLGKNQSVMNVVIIGSGTFAQRFTDLAIQVAQVPYFEDANNFSERKICVKTFSNDPDFDRELYLNFRPAVKDFVNINGSGINISDAYAQLDFLPFPAGAEDHLAKEIISHCDGKIDYIFVSLGNDELNQSMAKFFAETVSTAQINCPINFVAHNKNFELADIPFANPVYIAEPIKPDRINTQLERVAFNTHLSWSGGLSNADLQTARKDYLLNYNHEASLSFALSIRYKLFALGIDDANCMAAANAFAERITNKRLLALMAYYEHRRWLLEKVFEGWQPPRTSAGTFDYEHCLTMLRQNGKPQDNARFLHPCILRSSPEWTLHKNLETWNKPAANLDELDKMSVELHRAITRKAVEIKNSNPLAELKIISDIVVDDKQFQLTLKAFAFRLNQILAGNANHSRKFKAYFTEFRHSLEPLPLYIKEIINERLENLQRNFIFIAESNLRRDYKEYDFELVRKIPFLLTYSPPHVALAFENERHGATVRNVATASLLNPKRLTFLYCLDGRSRLELLSEKIASVKNYLHARKIRATVDFIVAVTGRADFRQVRQTFAELEINLCALQRCQNYAEAEKFFMTALDELKADLFDGSTALFPSQYYQSAFVQKISERLPYFELDPDIRVYRNCDHLKFIEDKLSLRLSDIFALNNLKLLSTTLFYEYADCRHKLWSIYSENRAAFHRLAAILRQHANNFKNFTFVQIPKLSSYSPVSLNFLLPSYAKDGTEFLLKQLAEFNLIKCFSISVFNDSLDVKILASRKIEPQLNKLFSNATDLIDPAFLKTRFDDNVATFFLSNLKVKGLALPEDQSIRKILKLLEKEHFILNVKFRQSRVTFDYASLPLKKILVTDSVLKCYICFELLASGFFDEVLTNVNFVACNNEPSQSSQLDFVLIKGFTCMVVAVCEETPLVSRLREFSNLAEEFDFPTKKILVMDEKNPPTTFVEKARYLDITLINRPDKIAEAFRQLVQERS